MKKTSRLVVSILLITIVMASLSVGAFAAFEWRMKVGDTFSLLLSDTEYKSSDTSVIVIEHKGGNNYTANAVGEGTARVTGGTWMGSNNQEYVITVTAAAGNQNTAGQLTPEMPSINSEDVSALQEQASEMFNQVYGASQENVTATVDENVTIADENAVGQQASEMFSQVYGASQENATITADENAVEQDDSIIDNLADNQATIEKVFVGYWIALGIIFVLAIVGMIVGVIYIFIEAPKCGMSRAWALVPLVSSILGLIVFIVVRSNHKKSMPTHKNNVTCPTCGGVHSNDTDVCSICGTRLK